MGSGKSVVGALGAEPTQAPFHDLDRMIENEAGMPIPDIFATGGEPAFRELEARVLPSALRPGSVVALGGGTLIDDSNFHLVADLSASVYLEVPFETMWQRIRQLSGEAARVRQIERGGRVAVRAAAASVRAGSAPSEQ
jgi:shikimate kinase